MYLYGCLGAANVTISVHPIPDVDFRADETDICQATVVHFTGSASPNIQSWNWDFGDGTTATGQTVSHAYTTEGIYLVNLFITDANGCIATTSVTITEPSALVASSSQGAAISCNGGTTTVTVSATGGTAPYTGTGSFSEVAGTYTYTVTDANGCTATTSVTITEPSALVASSSQGAAILCNGGTTTVTVSATGGTAPYTGTGVVTAGAGTHTYTVTDGLGCSSVTSITVSQPSQLVASSSASAILFLKYATKLSSTM